ncbi:MAG: glycine cleavage system aminomethyltransferase GcvT, partial [Bacteroidales bacterium]|nr:glycine cleavage system aminomethyltransferase GcvT [Bacteroidales bacterium]
MRVTALNAIHKSLGAKMKEFAGFEMPVEYSGIIDEHMAVRNSAAIFDVSHMGEFWITGNEAVDLINKISSNDPSYLSQGMVQYTCMPNGRGGIVDDLLVYCFDKERYLLVVNASNTAKDRNWILSNNTYDAVFDDISSETGLLAVQGPDAIKVLQKLTAADLAAVKSYHFIEGSVAGIDDIIISATGYTGAGGFELYFKNRHAPALWEALISAGSRYGIKPAGLGARDTLRLEMGYCLYGNDIDDTTSPIEAGLGWITKFGGREFVDSKFLEKQKNEGVSRRLRGFILEEKGIPRKGYDIISAEGEVIGKVTSGT